MSVMLSFAIFPTDKGTSVSEYVSKVIENIKDKGGCYKLTPMSTVVETNTMEEALAIIHESYQILEPQSERVYLSLTMDIKRGNECRMDQKIESIESKIGPVNK